MGILCYRNEWKRMWSNYDIDVDVQLSGYSSVFSPETEEVITGLRITGKKTIYEKSHGYSNRCIFLTTFNRSIDNILFYIASHECDGATVERIVQDVLYDNNGTLFNHLMEQKKKEPESAYILWKKTDDQQFLRKRTQSIYDLAEVRRTETPEKYSICKGTVDLKEWLQEDGTPTEDCKEIIECYYSDYEELTEYYPDENIRNQVLAEMIFETSQADQIFDYACSLEEAEKKLYSCIQTKNANVQMRFEKAICN